MGLLEPGQIVDGRYRIVRRIGGGGMGAVFEAEHLGVGRRVALKALLPEYAARPEVVGRFEHEARAAAAVGHEHIVEVLDVGRHGDSLFLVLELLLGETLGERLARDERMATGTAVALLVQVLAGLGAAHAAGIVHRDLKPDNVFLVDRPNGEATVKLLDFGISKFAGLTEAPNLTRTGTVVGTPYYMAPEQATARRDIDGRADIYACGVILYEMITGRLPFSADSEAELLVQIAYHTRPPRAPRELDPTLPEALSAAVMRAIAHDRDARFPSAEAFAEALAPFVGEPPSAAPARSARLSSEGVSGPHVLAVTTTDASASDLPAPAPRKRAGIWRASLGGALAIAAGAALAWIANTQRPAPAPAHVRASGSVARPALDPTVAIDLEQLPPEARVALDGRAADPRHLVLARGSTHDLEVTAPGMRPYRARIIADRDRSLVVSLEPEPAAALPAPVPTTPAPTPSTPGGQRPRRPTPHPRAVSGHGPPVQHPSEPARSPVHPANDGSSLPLNTVY